MTLWLCVLLAAEIPGAVIDLSTDDDDARVLGDDSSDISGSAVALGDLNGDGFADLILGAPGANQGTTTTLNDAGEVVVIFGQPAPFPDPIDLLSNPSGDDDIRILGSEAFADMGAALAVGDFNGDGFDDLAMGAPEADTVAGAPDRVGAGAVFIVLGEEDPPSRIDTAINRQDGRILAPDSGDSLGASLAAGDVNADGLDDLIIGAPEADRSQTGGNDQAGEVFVILGRDPWPALIDLGTFTSDVTIIRGDDTGDGLGTSVAAADIDGDGFDDVLAGAPGAAHTEPSRNNAGEVVVVTGAEPMPSLVDLDGDEDTLRILGDDSNDLSGTGVAAGDMDGDGRWEVLIGAPDVADLGIEEGEAYLWFGRTPLPARVDLAAGEEDVRVMGRDGEDRLGEAMAAGDFDGDGRDDWFVVAPLGDPGEPTARGQAGEVEILFGESLDLGLAFGVIDLDLATSDAQVHGDDSNDLWGTDLTVHDADRDGVADLLLGAPNADPDLRQNAGEGALVLGAAASPSAVRSRYDRAGDAPAGDFGPVLRAWLDFDAGNAVSRTTTTVTREAPTGSGLPPDVASVQWGLVTDRTGWTSAVLALRFTDAEIEGLDEGRLQIHQAPSASGPWTRLSTTLDERANLATATVTSLGFFALGEVSDSALLVDLLLGNVGGVPFDSDVNGDGVTNAADVVALVNMGR